MAQIQSPPIHYVFSLPSLDISLPLSVLLSNISPERLNQPATSPPTPELFILSPRFPWRLHVVPGVIPPVSTDPVVLPNPSTHIPVWFPSAAFQHCAYPPTALPSFFPDKCDGPLFVTVRDVIATVHSSMHTPMKQAEYNAMPVHHQKDIATSFHSRIDEFYNKKAWSKGAIRMDVLGSSHAAGPMKSWEDHQSRTALRQQEQSTGKTGEENGNVKATSQESRPQPSNSQSQPKTNDDMDDTRAHNPTTSHDEANKSASSPNSESQDNSADSPPNPPSSKPDSDDVAHGQEQQHRPTKISTDGPGDDVHSMLNPSSSSDDIEYSQKQYQPEPTETIPHEGPAEQNLQSHAPALSELLAQYDAVENPTESSSSFFENAMHPDVRNSIFNNIRGDQMTMVSNREVGNYNVFRSDTGGFYPVLPVLIAQTAGLTAIWTKICATEARQDVLDRKMYYFSTYHTTFTSTLFPIALLMYLYKYSGHIAR